MGNRVGTLHALLRAAFLATATILLALAPPARGEAPTPLFDSLDSLDCSEPGQPAGSQICFGEARVPGLDPTGNGALVTLEHDVLLTNIAVLVNPSFAGALRFVVFRHPDHVPLYVSAPQPFNAIGPGWRLSAPFELKLEEGQAYDIGALANVGAKWAYDVKPTQMNGLSSQSMNALTDGFGSPAVVGHAAADAAVRLYDSAVTTTSTSTSSTVTVTSSTTTTTLEDCSQEDEDCEIVECIDDEDCDDADPCTDDRCSTSGECVHVENDECGFGSACEPTGQCEPPGEAPGDAPGCTGDETGFDGLRCGLTEISPAGLCDAPLPRALEQRIARRLEKALELAGRAERKSAADARKRRMRTILRKLERTLASIPRLARKRVARKRISPECAGAIAASVARPVALLPEVRRIVGLES